MDYIDYQRINYIRRTIGLDFECRRRLCLSRRQLWDKEYHNGEYYEGQPFNYFNSTGQNPKYNEQMQEINDRTLYEAYKKQKDRELRRSPTGSGR